MPHSSGNVLVDKNNLRLGRGPLTFLFIIIIYKFETLEIIKYT